MAHKPTAKPKTKLTMAINAQLQTMPRQHATLSQREVEMLRLIADGLATKNIADKLFISIDTVETHRRNILKKLEAGNMVSAVAIAFRLKVLK